LSGIMTWQSGAPFSITSGRGTLNRTSRSYYNTASTSLTGAQLDQVVKFQMTGIGPRMIAASAVNPVSTALRRAIWGRTSSSSCTSAAEMRFQ